MWDGPAPPAWPLQGEGAAPQAGRPLLCPLILFSGKGRGRPLGGQSLGVNLPSSLSWPGLGSPCLGVVAESQALAARVGPVTPLSACAEPGVLYHGHWGPQRGQVLPHQLPPEAAPQERYWRVRRITSGKVLARAADVLMPPSFSEGTCPRSTASLLLTPQLHSTSCLVQSSSQEG